MGKVLNIFVRGVIFFGIFSKMKKEKRRMKGGAN